MVDSSSATPKENSDSLYFHEESDNETEESSASAESSDTFSKDTRPEKKRKSTPKKNKSITITPSMKEFQLIEQETLAILGGGEELEYSKVSETKCHNLAM